MSVPFSEVGLSENYSERRRTFILIREVELSEIIMREEGLSSVDPLERSRVLRASLGEKKGCQQSL
jgi:hypothetical protein